MKKLLGVFIFLLSLSFAQAQIITTVTKNDSTLTMKKKMATDWRKVDMSNRSNDHVMIQFGYDGLSGTPDSVNPTGFGRHFNAYFLLDKPFKSNPQFSAAFGAGIGTSNIFFKNTYVDVKSTSQRLPFTKQDSTNHFSKFKVASSFIEAPVELRFTQNPANADKSFKAALGVKVGYLINVHTKGKTLVDKNGNTINDYVEKIREKKHFNSTRFAATARVGYGLFTLYGAYQITTWLKDGAGAEMRPFSIGLCISGL